ncbi:uncharacterized protein [Temnothorax longispinosus]|uniref:uncharacterized protein n=1 Tax=Temnothorax longispinosus TaxID=300112 RepID=UPI003A9957D6
MLYFFHHYELPVILQQAQLQQLLFRNHAQPQAQPATPSTAPTTPGPGSSPSPSPTPSPSSSPSPSPSVAPSPSPSSNPNPSTPPTTEQTQQNYITELSQLDFEPSNTEEQHANADNEQTSATTTADRRDNSVRVSEDTAVLATSASVAKTEAVPSASGSTSSFTDTSSSEGFEVIESAEVVRKEVSVEDKKH